MTVIPAATDWASARGDKWRNHLAGMEAMLSPVDAPLLRALELDAPYRIADIACGGGGTTLEIDRTAPSGSIVHGFDISPALIALAQERATAAAQPVTFRVADMQTTPAPSEPYDRLVSRFGVMFFDDAPAAFVNIGKWLVPGGRFAFAVWGNPVDNPWISIVRETVATVVNVPSPDADAPNPFRYAEIQPLFALLTQAGFRELNVHEWCGALKIGGGMPAAQAADFALAAFSSFAALLTEAGAATQAAAQKSLTTQFVAHEYGGTVQLSACIHIVTGTRASAT